VKTPVSTASIDANQFKKPELPDGEESRLVAWEVISDFELIVTHIPSAGKDSLVPL